MNDWAWTSLGVLTGLGLVAIGYTLALPSHDDAFSEKTENEKDPILTTNTSTSTGTATESATEGAWTAARMMDEPKTRNLVELLLSLSEEQSRQEGVLHRGVTCNQCKLSIKGIRYKCTQCADVDLCEACESEVHGHSIQHVFAKIRIPLPPLSNPRSPLFSVLYPGGNTSLPDLYPSERERLVKQTHFDESELDALRQQFRVLSKPPNELAMPTEEGGIDQTAFAQCLGPLGLEKNLIAERIFSFFDQDNDGVITFNEFVCGLSILCKGTLSEKIQHAFHGYDVDHDGFISKDDLRKMYRAYFSLSMELVRDAVRAIEEEMIDEFDDQANKPVSAAFTAPIPESTGPSSSPSAMRPQKKLISSSAAGDESSTSSPVLITSPTRTLRLPFSPMTAFGSGPVSPLGGGDHYFPVMETMSQEAIEEMVERTFLAVDASGDGLIGFEAFEAFVQHDTTMIAWFEALGTFAKDSRDPWRIIERL